MPIKSDDSTPCSDSTPRPFLASTIDRAGLSAYQLRVLGHVCRRAAGSGTCYAGLRSMAKVTEMEPETVAKALKTLVDRNLIKVSSPHVYKLSDPSCTMVVPSEIDDAGLTPHEFRVLYHVICTESKWIGCLSSLTVMQRRLRIRRSKLKEAITSLMNAGWITNASIYKKALASKYRRTVPTTDTDLVLHPVIYPVPVALSNYPEERYEQPPDEVNCDLVYDLPEDVDARKNVDEEEDLDEVTAHFENIADKAAGEPEPLTREKLRAQLAETIRDCRTDWRVMMQSKKLLKKLDRLGEPVARTPDECLLDLVLQLPVMQPKNNQSIAVYCRRVAQTQTSVFGNFDEDLRRVGALLYGWRSLSFIYGGIGMFGRAGMVSILDVRRLLTHTWHPATLLFVLAEGRAFLERHKDTSRQARKLIANYRYLGLAARSVERLLTLWGKLEPRTHPDICENLDSFSHLNEPEKVRNDLPETGLNDSVLYFNHKYARRRATYEAKYAIL